MVTAADKFSTNETHFEFKWPKGVHGLERIACTAKGDLQRTLSAYFGKPIKVIRIWETPALHPPSSASPSNPIKLKRRVHLQCNGRLVTICTSTITLSDPLTASLFLDDKFAIGQMFRRLGRAPEFSLTEVGTNVDKEDPSKENLWRLYTLGTEGFVCEIKEVFPDRAMFLDESWIDQAAIGAPQKSLEVAPQTTATSS